MHPYRPLAGLADRDDEEQGMGGSFCQGEQILSDTMNLRRRNLAGEDALLDAERESLDAKIMIDTSRVSKTRLAFVSMPQAAML